MEDYRILYSIFVAALSIVFAWYINHYLIEKKRIADKQESVNKQTGMMIQAARDYELLSALIDEELSLGYQKKQNTSCTASSQKTLASVEKICARIPYQIVVDAKAKICMDEGISFEYHKQVEKERYLNGMDMVVVVGNLLDNAVESCLAQKNPSKIHVEVIQKMNQVSLRVANTKERKSKNGDISRYSTTKQNRLLHGYGLENVQEIVKKHYGDMKITDQDQWFVVEIEMECESVI